ncbi:DHA2 family efflux MFS transporter permease subunit [Paraburkholderia sp. UYCP14C]|uniref:DHA2 family efflux MFS transporter permease subunit n=1 Tax=Paraburkholderia sp. UYCP14C TaxID=2511130 RepID=UPI001020F8F0|nr:DHA2 family efflux MFS transporter permease subunit [Paraburkholderia sp. UYCP14C]RZF31660.1 DHA2 family efflux MFS transporter permease subunit [Paraburkholderia sp. UYCP14C]
MNRVRERDSASASTRIDPTVWKVAAVVSIGSFMSQMDSTLVNVSLSTIGHTLDASIATAQWIVSGYLLAMALMLPLNGWLVDRIGAKRLYLFCFSTFTIASMLCGAAQTIGGLIGARIFQGLVAGVLVPMAQMMIGRVAGKNLERVMGYTALPILLGPILGPVLAGLVLAHTSWPWLFFINVPVGVFGVAMAVLLLPRDAAASQKRPFDFTGFALISPGLVALVYGLQDASRAVGLACLLAGVVFLAWFVLHARRKGDAALIDVRMFATRTFSVAALAQFFANGIMYGRQLAVPLFLIAGCGLSAAHAGGLLAATGVGMMCSFALLGWLTERLGCRALAAGGALLAFLSTLVFLWMSVASFSAGWAAVSLFFAGVGQGTISVPSISAAYSSIARQRLAVANTALNIAQRVGGPFATTLLSMVIASTLHGASGAQPSRFLPTFALLAALHLLCFAAAMFLPLRVQSAKNA